MTTRVLGSTLGRLGRMDEARALLERSHAVLDENDARYTRAVVFLREAPAHRLAGDPDAEARAVETALGLRLESEIVGRSPVAPEAVAWLRGDADRHVEAATLLGTADTVMRAAGVIPGPLRRELREAITIRARDTLGAGPFEAAFNAGAGRALPDALRLASRLVRE